MAKTNLPENTNKLKDKLSQDAVSGFLVFMLALPLSLGIARASDFPPVMGLITAMIGGLIVSFLAGSALTIKGPAAGMIAIVAAAVSDFGQGDTQLGWKMALGTIVIAGLIQIFFGLIKLGSIVDFFPLSALLGMLAAIGIIIFSKQIHVLFGVSPVDSLGKPITEPIDLLLAIPNSISTWNGEATLIGIISLMIVFLWPRIKKSWLQHIPFPVVVMLIAIPLGQYIELDSKYFVHFEKGLAETLRIHVQWTAFKADFFYLSIKYTLLFALIGSIESLLTVKAIDMLDPLKRKSNANKDLIAVGIGNILCGLLGALPMISEVARSTANIKNGAKSRWANFFHGLFMMIFLLLGIRFNNLIPTPALAALLIGIGYQLASPGQFGRMAKIGIEQLTVFLITVITTIATDLLLGIAAGIVVKLISQMILGTPVRSVFKAHTHIHGHCLKVAGAAVFSNWRGIKREIQKLNQTTSATIDLSNCNVVDFTVIDNLHHLKIEFANAGGQLEILGLEELRTAGNTNHAEATRTKEKESRTTLRQAKRKIRKSPN